MDKIQLDQDPDDFEVVLQNAVLVVASQLIRLGFSFLRKSKPVVSAGETVVSEVIPMPPQGTVQP
jgi:hypothetical protein